MRMPHDFHPEGGSVEHHKSDLASHRKAVERFHQRKKDKTPPRRRHIGLWILGTLLLAGTVYAACRGEDEQPGRWRPINLNKPPAGWPW